MIVTKNKIKNPKLVFLMLSLFVLICSLFPMFPLYTAPDRTYSHLYLDFGPGGSPIAFGCMALGNDNSYNKQLGYGWTDELDNPITLGTVMREEWNSSGDSDFYMDGHYSGIGTYIFKIHVTEPGNYTYSFYYADNVCSGGPFDLYVNDILVKGYIIYDAGVVGKISEVCSTYDNYIKFKVVVNSSAIRFVCNGIDISEVKVK